MFSVAVAQFVLVRRQKLHVLMNSNTFLIGMVAGAIGLGYFVYGKKQSKVVPLLCGIALMAYPYFIENIWILLGIGLVLCLVPFFV